MAESGAACGLGMGDGVDAGRSVSSWFDGERSGGERGVASVISCLISGIMTACCDKGLDPASAWALGAGLDTLGIKPLLCGVL